MIVDTHCHLDDPRYRDDLEALLLRAKEAGVGAVIIPGADPDTLPLAREIAHTHKNIYYAAGVHPYDMEKYDPDFLAGFLEDPLCVAVGECGLDYYRLPEDDGEKEAQIKEQKRVFADQIALAKRFKKPLIVHIREASGDALALLLQEGADEVGGVLHCYNADERLLALASKGFYFGIGGVLTFKNAKKLPSVLPKIPLDRLVVETDGPYLTPHPHRGKRNEPAYTRLVLKKMGEVLGMEEKTLETLTTQNAQSLFGIAPKG